MDPIFIQLAIILSVAFIVAYIIKLFKQPIIIGYILAGIIISPFILRSGASTELIHTFSQFGIAFLLFVVGLHLNPRVIKEIGTSSLLIGLGQMILTFGLGYGVSLLLGFSSITGIYVGIALSFSSTIIIMKLLSDKQHLDSLYGKISIGILIIQDLVAIAVLMIISSVSGGLGAGGFEFQNLLIGIGLIVFLFLCGFYILPRLTKNIAKHQELLFLFSIFWCFLIAALFGYIGFSIEIGALIAGIVLSVSPYSVEISSKIRPLRDFFLIIFFIILGLNMPILDLGSVVVNALILSAVVLIAKPLILMLLTSWFRYTKRTTFLVGSTLAQISEFSLIVLLLGVSVGHISTGILHTLTLTLIITLFISTYGIIYSKGLYKRMYGFVSLFERKRVRKEKDMRKRYDAVLFGYNRIGFSILRSLKKIKEKYIVVDFNPDTIADLKKFNIPCLYGDVDDPELLRELPLDKINMAVSTVPDFETNVLLIENIRFVNPKAIVIVRAHSISEAMKLYEEGASYVLTPHFLGGEYVAKMIRELKTSRSDYKEEKKKHMKMLKDISRRGHEHPEVERN
jgi:Kef-type K+ transport system membrane component KefB/Trk K+ transport system NAD-binding subunit